MVTKKTDLQRDMDFGQAMMITATPDEDMKQNTDYTIVSKVSGSVLKIAYRTRRTSLAKYGQVSIRHRRRSGAVTEWQKIINGTSKAHLYIFEFTDAYVICPLDDIKPLLEEGKFEVVSNHDGQTEAAYINLSDLPHHFIVWKE